MLQTFCERLCSESGGTSLLSVYFPFNKSYTFLLAVCLVLKFFLVAYVKNLVTRTLGWDPVLDLYPCQALWRQMEHVCMCVCINDNERVIDRAIFYFIIILTLYKKVWAQCSHLSWYHCRFYVSRFERKIKYQNKI